MTRRSTAFFQFFKRIGWESLWGIGTLTALLYMAMLVFYGEDPHQHSRLQRELFLWPLLIALSLCYLRGYTLVKNNPAVSPGGIWVFAALFGVFCILLPPFHSTDLYGYINRGWQQWAYGANPYTVVIDNLPHWQQDPMITDHWVNNPCPYGFLFAQLAKGLCAFSQWLTGTAMLSVTARVFKVSNLLWFWGVGAWVWLAAKRLGKSSALALYTLLWNPLILLQHLANGHNDLWMGGWVLLSGVMGVLGAWLWVVPALTAAVLMKYAAVLCMPFAVVYTYQKGGLKTLFLGLMLSAGLVYWAGLPYWSEWAHFPWQAMGENAGISHNSLHAAVFHTVEWLENLLKIHPVWLDMFVRKALKPLLWFGFLALLAKTFWRTLIQPKNENASDEWVTLLVWVHLLLVCVVSAKAYPWYLGMVLPVAVLLGEETSSQRLLTRLLLVLSCSQLFAFTFVGQAHVLNYLLLTILPVAVTVWRFRKKPYAADAGSE